MINKRCLADIEDVTPYLRSDTDLTINEYHQLVDANKSFTDTSLIQTIAFLKFLRMKMVPVEHQSKLNFLQDIIASNEILSKTVSFPGRPFGITLYELAKEHGKFPNRILSNDEKPIEKLIEEYEFYEFLKRYFLNQGKVFFTEASPRIYAHLYAHVAPVLVTIGVLRTGRESEMTEALDFKTKAELVQILESHGFDMSRIGYQTRKSELIEFVCSEGLTGGSELMQFFYFLSDDYYDFKLWISRELAYFSIYSLFQAKLSSAFIGFHEVLKSLEKLEDYELAEKLGQLYVKQYNILSTSPNFVPQWENKKIKAVLSRIRKRQH